MKRSALILIMLLPACGASAPATSHQPAPPATAAQSAASAKTLGMTVGEFQDRWNAAIGMDSLEIREVDQRATTFEARVSPVVRLSGTTDADGLITAVRVTYSGATDITAADGALEEMLDVTFAFETLPSVVATSLPVREANQVLTGMGYPKYAHLEGLDLEGAAGGVQFTLVDEGGLSGVVMTAEPLAP